MDLRAYPHVTITKKVFSYVDLKGFICGGNRVNPEETAVSICQHFFHMPAGLERIWKARGRRYFF